MSLFAKFSCEISTQTYFRATEFSSRHKFRRENPKKVLRWAKEEFSLAEKLRKEKITNQGKSRMVHGECVASELMEWSMKGTCSWRFSLIQKIIFDCSSTAHVAVMLIMLLIWTIWACLFPRLLTADWWICNEIKFSKSIERMFLTHWLTLERLFPLQTNRLLSQQVWLIPRHTEKLKTERIFRCEIVSDVFWLLHINRIISSWNVERI